MRLRLLVASPLLLLPLTILSCQGDDTTSPVAAGTDAASSQEGASGCPPLAPDAGAPCAIGATVDCVYGPDPACHPIAWSCTASGWQPVTSTPPPPVCPASEPAPGSPCLLCTPEGQACDYDAGCVATCTEESWALSAACGVADAGEDSGAEAGADAGADGGADAGEDASVDANPDAAD